MNAGQMPVLAQCRETPLSIRNDFLQIRHRFRLVGFHVTALAPAPRDVLVDALVATDELAESQIPQLSIRLRHRDKGTGDQPLDRPPAFGTQE